MKLTRDLVKKLEMKTTDEAVQVLLQYVLDNTTDIDKKLLLVFMRNSVEKFFKGEGK